MGMALCHVADKSVFQSVNYAQGGCLGLCMLCVIRSLVFSLYPWYLVCVCVCVCVCVVSYFSHVQLFAMLWAVACQAPLSMEVFRLEYWSGLSLPSTGNLADPGTIPVSPALQAYSLLAEPLGSLKVASVPWII